MNLILIIGTNPLPNFVVAKYFIDNKNELKNIFLIYSAGSKFQNSTREYADNIVKVLNSNQTTTKINFKYVPLIDIENQKTNIIDLNSVFDDFNSDEMFHLNYTGGTKTMGIHVYNYLKEKYREKFESSYLSSKIFKLINENGELITDDLRKIVSLNLSEIISLHGFVRANSDCDYNFEQALIKFEEYINNDNLKFYFQSYDRIKFSANSGNLIKSSISLNKNLHISNGLCEINNCLPDNYRLFDPRGNLLLKLPEDSFIEKTIEFIDGKWLEEYVYKILNETLPSYIKKMKNWEVKKPSWSKDLRFELDVILINGYQLCGISISTADKKRKCKHKGFEIIMRTKQMGGDESKAVLVTRLTEQPVKELQNELEIDTGSTSKNILVLGVKDFKKEILIKNIKNFMEVSE